MIDINLIIFSSIFCWFIILSFIKIKQQHTRLLYINTIYIYMYYIHRLIHRQLQYTLFVNNLLFRSKIIPLFY